VSALSVGGATLIEMRTASGGVWRSEQEIVRTRSDALCIYQQIDCGGCHGNGSEFVVSLGSLATCHSDFMEAAKPAPGAGYHLRLVKIPLSRCKMLVGPGLDLFAHPLKPERGVTGLFTAYFESFIEEAPYLSGTGAEAAVQALSQLALMACGRAAPGEERQRETIRRGVLQNARQVIEGHIHRSDLSPATVAGMLGISVRQLHLLFEPTGVTYARYVLSRRLEHARLLLAQTPERPVADIAYACGFDSLSTFYRRFRTAFDQTPAAFRARVRTQRAEKENS
jgi:AraC-like DNA-binding protein